jgi:predicted MFS family arabinose efflux permease
MTKLAVAYNITPFRANLANSTSAWLFLPFFFLATQMYNRMSLRKVLLICSIIIFFGAWVRLLVMWNGNFWWLILGQTIIGLSSPITTGGVSVLANYWFADMERGRATSLMMVSNPLGFFVSFLI